LFFQHLLDCNFFFLNSFFNELKQLIPDDKFHFYSKLSESHLEFSDETMKQENQKIQKLINSFQMEVPDFSGVLINADFEKNTLQSPISQISNYPIEIHFF
jgi:hypothetical protein